MKHIEIINLYSNLKEIKGYKGVKFNYCINKNLKNLDTEVEPLGKTEQGIVSITNDFVTKRKELQQLYALKNENGDFVITNDDKGLPKYNMPPDKKLEFMSKLKELEEKHKDIIAEQKLKHEEFTKMLEEENKTFTPFTIDIKDLPEDITTEDMNKIFILIIE